ncbi:hypothetical protein [Saccharothrix sp. NRRL B-16314]|uniref:hypothetical protein n=1 Tax=Saccharothrix sp. NRRL B-16314 TaxID=1463825 RepID=UPI000527BF4F|nr:hypothetical protein [Saccharothrix sp. NRRL B-16314]
MTHPPASGSFDHDRWHLVQPGDDPNSSQFASAHESHHKQLQDSTSFGAVARTYHALWMATGAREHRETAGALTRASSLVQEAFASWLPALALGWDRDRVVRNYPGYRAHFDAMAEVVASVDSPYLRFHVAHAVSRACMQTSVIERVLDVGLANFSLADLRERELPDIRFGLLRRHLPDWSAHVPADPRLTALVEPATLTAEMFDPALEELWVLVNEAVYDAAASALGGDGTLGVNEHLLWTPKLVAAARELAGAVDIEPGTRLRQAETRAVVLGNTESEGFSVAGPLPARVLPDSTALSLMTADLERPHLFATVRRSKSLTDNYTWEPGSRPPTGDVLCVVRRTVREDDGRHVVELRRATDLAEVHRSEVPVIAVVPCTLLDHPAAAGWRPARTALLLDLPLTEHLDLWLDAPGSRFRYTFLRTESFGRVVPFLVGSVEHDGHTLPLMLRPLSHAGVRVHQAALAELYPPGGKVVADHTFLGAYENLLGPVLAHLAGEEVRFDNRMDL